MRTSLFSFIHSLDSPEVGAGPGLNSSDQYSPCVKDTLGEDLRYISPISESSTLHLPVPDGTHQRCHIESPHRPWDHQWRTLRPLRRDGLHLREGCRCISRCVSKKARSSACNNVPRIELLLPIRASRKLGKPRSYRGALRLPCHSVPKRPFWQSFRPIA